MSRAGGIMWSRKVPQHKKTWPTYNLLNSDGNARGDMPQAGEALAP